MLDNLPPDIRANLIIQQDGSPAHNANVVRDYLNGYFPNPKNSWCSSVTTRITRTYTTGLLFSESLKSSSVGQSTYVFSRFKI